MRPYSPALPRLKGGELALVAMEHLSKLEPPTTLADVVRQLATLGAAGVAVRGEVDERAVAAAIAHALPLLRLDAAADLHEIEQSVMRQCALHQARREISPIVEPENWLEALLAGRDGSLAEAQSMAKRHGYDPAGDYSVAYIARRDTKRPGSSMKVDALQRVRTFVDSMERKATAIPTATELDGGLAVMLPDGSVRAFDPVLNVDELACGIGGEKPFPEAKASLAEARMAALASDRLRKGAVTRYRELGGDRLLLLLYRDRPEELQRFVEETLGPLLRHDERAATPLLPTVESFVAHGGRLRETAADMIVHRNTLAYRLGRAAELLGLDLKEADKRLAIELALRAVRLTGSPRKGDDRDDLTPRRGTRK